MSERGKHVKVYNISPEAIRRLDNEFGATIAAVKASKYDVKGQTVLTYKVAPAKKTGDIAVSHTVKSAFGDIGFNPGGVVDDDFQVSMDDIIDSPEYDEVPVRDIPPATDTRVLGYDQQEGTIFVSEGRLKELLDIKPIDVVSKPNKFQVFDIDTRKFVRLPDIASEPDELYVIEVNSGEGIPGDWTPLIGVQTEGLWNETTLDGGGLIWTICGQSIRVKQAIPAEEPTNYIAIGFDGESSMWHSQHNDNADENKVGWGATPRESYKCLLEMCGELTLFQVRIDGGFGEAEEMLTGHENREKEYAHSDDWQPDEPYGDAQAMIEAAQAQESDDEALAEFSKSSRKKK